MIFRTILFSLLFFFVSCEPTVLDSNSKKKNVLTEYVKTPLDKAKGVDAQAEERAKQFDSYLADSDE